MTRDLELVTASEWTDAELRSAVATAWLAHGLSEPEITGEITENLVVEVATDDELSLQMFRPHPRTTQAGPRLVTAMAMSTHAGDQLIAAVLAAATTLAGAHGGHLTIDGDLVALDDVPAPDPGVQLSASPDLGERPDHPPVFASVFLDTLTPAEEGWRSMVAALGTWVGDRHDWRPVWYRPDEEWEPFDPEGPAPDWWPDSIDLATGAGVAEWSIDDAAFPEDRLAQIGVTLRVPPDAAAHLLDQVQALDPWQPAYAMVHPWDDREPFAVYGPRHDSAEGPALMLHDRALAEEGLPHLYWGNVLGQPWVALIGAERIAATPAHRVEEILPGRWLIQLTARPSDVSTDWENFAEVRRRCVAHLGREFFHNPERLDQSADRTATIPTLAERGLVR